MPGPSRSLAVLAALVLLGALLTGCRDGGPTDRASAADLVKSEVAREAPAPGAAAEAAAATAAFGVDLYHQLRAVEEGNLVFSPYSAAIALAMARAGAAGETAAQMDAVLRAGPGLHVGFNALDQALAERPGEFEQEGGSPARLQFSTANALWGQRGFALKQPFLDTLARDYGAGMFVVDYVEDAEGARVEINRWVSEQTAERIPDLIPPGVLDELTRLVLTNAVYLNAPWLFPFDEDGTEDGPFTRLDGSTVDAPLMRLGARLPYAAGAGWQAVELPYIGASLAMVVIVPDEGTFTTFEERLDGSTLRGVVDGLGDAMVTLRMPRFEFRTQASLADPLKAMGMPVAFTEDADFSAITDAERMLIQDVLHEAFISVDEAGTEAAAATAVVIGVVSAPSQQVELTLDRPFLFLIHDRETGAPLFLGRVVDPGG